VNSKLENYIKACKKADKFRPAVWSHAGDKTGIGAEFQHDGSLHIYESTLSEDTRTEWDVTIPYEQVGYFTAWLLAQLEE
jgi:hypothetical protein